MGGPLKRRSDDADQQPRVQDILKMQVKSGRLTPFIGAGMSMNGDKGLVGWSELISQLAGADATQHIEDLTARGESIGTRLRAEGTLPEKVRIALLPKGRENVDPPEQCRALAGKRWPLVITTNYDDLYLAAANEARPKVGHRSGAPERPVVLGRSPADCRRVLRALRAPDHPLVWAVQGFLGGQAPRANSEVSDRGVLSQEIVLGHSEYRRVTHAEPHFRRSFAEVLRSTSLIFLGSSVERYLLELFSEIIELHGPSPYPHFAVFTDENEPREKRQHLAFTHGIHSIFLNREELSGFISKHLNAEPLVVRQADAEPLVVRQGLLGSGTRKRASLEICPTPVPAEPNASGWRVFSLGGPPNHPELNKAATKALHVRGIHLPNDWTSSGESQDPENWKPEIWRPQENRTRDRAVYARLSPAAEPAKDIRPIAQHMHPDPSRTRNTHGAPYARDLRVIAPAVRTVMDAASNEGVGHVHIQLLAADASWRTFPPAFSFIEMVRGWAQWLKGRPNQDSRSPALTIHLGDGAGERVSEVWTELVTGRIELQMLHADQLRLWIDVPDRPDDHVRIPTAALSSDLVMSPFIGYFPISEDDVHWRLTVEPEPCRGWEPWTVAEIRRWERERRRPMDLTTFGVVPYSVLRLLPPDNRHHGRD